MVSVLFVCLGNICRSPTAHGIFEHKVAQQPGAIATQITVDSAGTGDWHVGRQADARAQAAAQHRGYDLSALRARQVTPEDFSRFDYILAMDLKNFAHLKAMAPASFRGELAMFLDYLPDSGLQREVPDPYFGGEEGFNHVLDLVETAAEGLLHHILQHHFSG